MLLVVRQREYCSLISSYIFILFHFKQEEIKFCDIYLYKKTATDEASYFAQRASNLGTSRWERRVKHKASHLEDNGGTTFNSAIEREII